MLYSYHPSTHPHISFILIQLIKHIEVIRIGLDMYLVVERQKNNQRVHEELIYWRKANHIHRWFIEHVQSHCDDCRVYPVNQTQLRALMNQCEQTLLHCDQPERYLPTLYGPFFGSTDYDDLYFLEILRTKELLHVILTAFSFDHEPRILYSSSW